MQGKSQSPGQALPAALPNREQKESYWGTAVELAERPKFPQHLRQGAARTDAGIRFICEADTIDDPDRQSNSKVTARASGQRWRCGTAGATRPIGTILRERSSSWTSCLCRSGTPAAAADEQSKKPPELAVSSHLSSSGLTTAHSQV